MTETYPSTPHSAIEQLSSHELQGEGFILGPDQAVAIDTYDCRENRTTLEGNGTKLQGYVVAEVDFGNEATFATARVLDIDDPAIRDRMVVHVSDNTGKFLFGAWVGKGEPLGLGKAYKGQGELPITTAPDQLGMVIDEEDRLVIKSNSPSAHNVTRIRQPASEQDRSRSPHQFAVARDPNGGRDRVISHH